MSDKERTSPGAAAPSPIETADIWSDGTETASDRRIREFTLRELEKSKKTLPKERYEALVKAVGDILRTHYEREEEVHESVRTKIAEFKNEVDLKNVPGCLRNKFDPVMINGRETAEYLTDATSTPEKFEAFKRLLSSDGELMAGFVRYWVLLDMRGEVSNSSNVKRIMTQNRGADGVAKLNDFHRDNVDSMGIILNDETLNVRRGGSTERKNEGVADQLKLKFNFYPRENGKYYEREGNKVSKDFAAITGGASLSKFRNEEIADVFSYAYVHSNKQYPLANESWRVPDAISKIKARFAHDPAGLIAISEWWGGDLAKTKPAIDKRLQVGDAKGIKKEFITTAKEAFEEATMNIVDDFTKRQLGEGASSEKIAKVANEIQSVIEKTSADPQTNYFSVVGGKIVKILEKAGAKELSAKDNLAFIRQMLGVTVASREFDAKNDPKESKYLTAFKDCKDAKDVEAAKAKLLSSNPADKTAIEKCAGMKMLSLASEGVAMFWGFRISEMASKAVFHMAWPTTPDNVQKQAGHIIQAEKSLNDLNEKSAALKEVGPIKPFEDMTDAELRGAKIALDAKKEPTEEDRIASEALAKYIKDRTPARREFVALATGKTYDEVVRLERSGQNLDTLFEQAKKEPIPTNRKNAEETVAAPNRSDFRTFADDSFARTEMKVGQSYELRFSETSASVEITKTSDSQNPYRVSVAGKEAYECNEKNLDAHLDMAKLLCDNGLEFLAPVSKEMLKKVSVHSGSLATAEDGRFTDREKRLMLRGFASAFEIEGFPIDSVEASDMESYLKTFATERSTTFRDLGMRSKILDENGNIRNREVFLSRLGG